MKIRGLFFILFLLICLQPAFSQQEKTTFSIALDPNISWFASDHRDVNTSGVKSGVSFGLVMDNFFSDKYAFTTGLFMTHAGGKLAYENEEGIVTSVDTTIIPAGNELKYGLQYVNVPIGLKLKTTEIGYLTYYVELGVKAMVRISSQGTAPNNLLDKEKINQELAMFNMAYYMGAGFEYSIGGSTSLVGGLYYNSTFLDISKDLVSKPNDYLRMHIMNIRLGVLF